MQRARLKQGTRNKKATGKKYPVFFFFSFLVWLNHCCAHAIRNLAAGGIFVHGFSYNHIKLCLRSICTTVCTPSTFLVSRTRCVWIHSVETIDASSSSSSPVRGKIERERGSFTMVRMCGHTCTYLASDFS